MGSEAQIAVADLQGGQPRTGQRVGLPVQASSFVGRERELDDLKGLLAASRLLTLTGPGGCGKTRLALQTAAHLVEDFEDGIGFVELAAPEGPNPDASTNPEFAPIHTYHLGLFFDSPGAARRSGCPDTVTPFNGEHRAGIKALSTRNFPDNRGPLRAVDN